MPKLYSSKEIEKVFERKFRKGTLTVIVPMSKKEIPFGTFRSILRQANLAIDEFKDNTK